MQRLLGQIILERNIRRVIEIKEHLTGFLNFVRETNDVMLDFLRNYNLRIYRLCYN